ncbi:MAG: response regulator [Candidatus Gastranaerophilales bacterium]|nr:response regulator [Candidatus Gastranaerophilales bacterium]
METEDKRYRVLIVDDEEDNLALLYRTLRTKYAITKAHSAIEALEILKDQKFDCILSDHKMPLMDGVEFLKRVNDIQPKTMRLLVTAYSDVKILIDAINYAKIYRYIKKPYSPDELLMIVEAALETYQLKMDNENLITDLKDLFSGTVKAIIEALDAKDSFTLGRSRRVAFYALKIVNKMALSPTEVSRIELAGLLHDIGMIGVAEEILNKTQKLSDEEYEKIKMHVHYSVKILEDIKQLSEITEIIKYHHEYYNGCGYPYGLKGDQIPLGSRIIAIADAYDSMISNRAYRKSLTSDEALKIIEQGAGKQFDPDLVEIFKSILPDAIREIEQYEAKNFYVEQ